MKKILVDVNVLRCLCANNIINSFSSVDDDGNRVTVYFYDGMQVKLNETYLFFGRNTLMNIARYYVINNLSFNEIGELLDEMRIPKRVSFEALFEYRYSSILRKYGFIFEDV